jgi:hypothetical protein
MIESLIRETCVLNSCPMHDIRFTAVTDGNSPLFCGRLAAAMSLRFIYGRAGSGKSSYCLKDIKEKLDKGYGKKLVLIVPEPRASWLRE